MFGLIFAFLLGLAHPSNHQTKANDKGTTISKFDTGGETGNNKPR